MRRLLLSLLLLGGLVALAPSARAGDGEPGPSVRKGRPDFVRQLTDAERAFLRSKFEGWDTLPIEKRQRIAQNVVRLRSMTPEEKQRLEAHIKRMKRRPGGGPGRHEHGRFHDRATGALINRAIAREARRALGRDFERELRKRDISERAFEMSVAGSFWRRISARRAAGGEPVAPDALPDDFPQHWRASYAETYKAYAALAPDAKERAGQARRLHFRLAMHQGERFRAKVRAMDLKGEQQLDAVGAAVQAEWPEALPEVTADPEALLRGAERHELRHAAQRLLRRTERLEKEEAAVLASLLNRLAVHHREKATDADARAAADDLLKAVLQRELRVPASVLADMPPASEPEARLAFLAGLAGRGRGFGPGGPKDRKDRPSRGPRGGEGVRWVRQKPEGVSDADWAIFKTIVEAAMKARDFEALRAFRTQKPEGMSDEGYQAILTSMKDRPGGRKGRQGPR